MGRRRQGSGEELRFLDARSERGLGLAGVEAVLEIAPDRLTVREHRVVAHATRRQLHDADVVVSLSMAARICRRLVEGAEALPFRLAEHTRTPSRWTGERKACASRRSALCDEFLAPLGAAK